MPISFLNERHRLQRLGRIRQGHAETYTRDGQVHRRPVADPFFVVPNELAHATGENPTRLCIMFLSDHMEDVFPHYLRRYSARGLRCLGDGQQVLYRINDDGQRDVADGFLRSSEEPLTLGTTVSCDGETCTWYTQGLCKATGYLRFIVAAMPRLGYWDLVCHQRAVIVIKTQLEVARRTFGRLTNIPFVLHRGDEEQVPVMVKGKITDMPVRTPWVEVEPEWFQTNIANTTAVLRESRQLRQLQAGAARADLYGEEHDDDFKPHPPSTMAEFEEESYDGEGDVEAEKEQEIQNSVITPPPTNNANTSLSPAPHARTRSAENTRAWFAQQLASAPPSDELPSAEARGLAVNLLTRALSQCGPQARKLVSEYLCGKASATQWTKAETNVFLNWGVGTKNEQGGYALAEHFTEEALLIYRAALLAKGQLELPPMKEV